MGTSSVLVRTYLSQPPRASAKVVMAASLFLIVVLTLGRWRNDWTGLIATPEAVFEQGQVYRLFTAILIHADFGHLLGNALTFTILGFLLYGYYGFFIYPFAAFGFGALANALTLLAYPPHSGVLGASGVIYWMAGFWVTLYFAIDRRFSRSGRLLRCVGFSLAVFAPTSYDPNVAYSTHAFGYVLGIGFGGFFFLWRKPFFRKAERFVEENPEEVLE